MGKSLSVYYHGITYLHASKLVLDVKDHVYAAITDII